MNIKQALKAWSDNMLKYGDIHGRALSDPAVSDEQKLANCYYDAAWVYCQIAEYTQDTRWFAYVINALEIYRDKYLIPNAFKAPGYWNFSHGLLAHYKRFQSEISKDALIQLSLNAAYCPDTTPLDWTADSTLSREVAYAIATYLNAEFVGAPRRERLYDLVEQALGHIDQWFVSKKASYVRPFMVGLTAHALRQYYDQVNQDPRILSWLDIALESLWKKFWRPKAKAFIYGNSDTPEDPLPAPDLNLLIAPAYAWQWKMTKKRKWISRANLIFIGGVEGAYLGNAKQFNQNYRLSFEYVKLRQA